MGFGVPPGPPCVKASMNALTSTDRREVQYSSSTYLQEKAQPIKESTDAHLSENLVLKERSCILTGNSPNKCITGRYIQLFTTFIFKTNECVLSNLVI
jgi:hypothetical protein